MTGKEKCGAFLAQMLKDELAKPVGPEQQHIVCALATELAHTQIDFDRLPDMEES